MVRLKGVFTNHRSHFGYDTGAKSPIMVPIYRRWMHSAQMDVHKVRDAPKPHFDPCFGRFLFFVGDGGGGFGAVRVLTQQTGIELCIRYKDWYSRAQMCCGDSKTTQRCPGSA